MISVSELNVFCEAGVSILTAYQTDLKGGFLPPAGIPGLSPALFLHPKMHYSLEVGRMIGL